MDHQFGGDTMNPYIIEKQKEGYLLFTINRPDKRNAVNYDIIKGLEEAVSKAAASDVKALVITGSGDKAFCSGGDLSIFHQLRTEEEAYEMLIKMARVLTNVLLLPKPTIALMNGTAVGGGCEVASACDFRIARQGIKAGFVQGKLAITTGWGGGSMLLEKLSPANGLKMLLEAELYDTSTLKELGFLNYIYEGDHQTALNHYLQHILQLDRDVLSSYKELLVKKWKVSGIAKRIEEEVSRCSMLWERDEHHKLVEKFNSKK